MKAYIGPYCDRWISNIHTNYMNRKYGRFVWSDNTNRFERILEKVEDAFQWLYNKTINRILDKRSSQKIKVRIDNYDTWSMDYTLAHIIAPMLKQLHKSKHGSPYVRDEDVPEELKTTSAPPKEYDYDIDDNHHLRWDWVLNEMIWAFEQKARDGGWEGDYYKYEDDPNEMLGLKCVWSDDEGRMAHQARMNNGFRLFGKYFEALWD